MPKKVSRNTCCFHRIAVFANDKALFLRLGSSVHHFEHVIKQETHIFTKMITNNENFQILPKFYQKELITKFS